MTLIVHQSDATDPTVVGGKAAALSNLARFGFNPPAFFVITESAFRPGKTGPVAVRGLNVSLGAALDALGPGPYAVRSSGRAEDGAEHSHAGQFDTVLNVSGGRVLQAAKQVWQSGFSETVATYRAVKSGGGAEAPSIIVQRMIDATAAGVAFSADPVTGQRNTVVVSAVKGLGDALVSGEVDGEDWTIDPAGQAECAQASPEVLTPDQAHKIAALARKAEQAFGVPQDIEWAFDADGLHILQARPITTELRPAALKDDRLTIFDNSNIVESYPGMVSPLTYSFALHVYSRVYRAFVQLLGVSDSAVAQNATIFDNLLGRIDGRVYYNLVNWYNALALLPGFSLNRDYMETMMGVSEPMPREITDAIGPAPAKGARKVVEYAKLATVAGGLVWQAVRLPRTRRNFYARLNDVLGRNLDINAANATDLAAEYRHIESTLLDRWDAPLINDFLCMIAFGASRNLLHKWLGEDGLLLHNDVMIGQGDIVSAEPAQRIARMGGLVRDAGIADQLGAECRIETLAAFPSIAAEVQSYLDKFGDRCTEELKLESIPLRDDPSSLLMAVAASAARPEGKRHIGNEPDWKTQFPANPLKRQLSKWIVGWAKARVRDRENLRFERTRIFGHARRVFLGIGREFSARGLLSEPRDVFHLTTHEVLGAVEGFSLSPNLKAIVAQRQSEDEAASRRLDPPERIEIRGPAIAPIWAQNAEVDNDPERVKTGTGCSAGHVTAQARVIRDPRTEALQPGDILVARHTDPGWIAVFSNAAAIVVERGSLLSHSAIVARELGIPCVVGLKGATQWIKDGETLSVDGASGKVERCDGA
ncbi:PEP/pyruvate-binding domain-containing protein [Ruegeria meonggei]|uniref:Chondramide synthase cmdD n=1 Tax=Ruegeria meonggei TaxID=1446476 RepID=A0A1X6ZZW6_9RHOB|nr:PEP/pyruvate-binding domain-containing protein [Ruegeria meonggei]SLN66404.1 Chondramide synthase cmdD [Ruegeria meonggei]